MKMSLSAFTEKDEQRTLDVTDLDVIRTGQTCGIIASLRNEERQTLTV